MIKMRRSKSDAKKIKMRRSKSDTELAKWKKNYKDKESQTNWCLTTRKERRGRYQLYETILKAIRVTFEVKSTTQIPYNLQENGILQVLLESVAPSDNRHTTHQLMIIILSHTCNETKTVVFEEDLARNSKLVFHLKKTGPDIETREHLILEFNENDKNTGDVQFEDGIKFTVQITKERKSDIESRDFSRLCLQEQDYCVKRKQHVFTELRENLTDDFISEIDHVPNIAIIGSGGGMRAVIGMSGAMTALQRLHILDYAMYTAGLSGSAWYLMTLYAYAEQFDPKRVNEHIRLKLHENSGTYIWMGLKILLYYTISFLSDSAVPLTCTNIYGELIGRILLGEKCNQKWSEQAMKLEDGCIPLPLLAAMHVRSEKTRHEYNEWIELSPYQALLPSYGAAIKMNTFGKIFSSGFCTKEFEELPIHFLQGMCGSAYAIARDQRPQGLFGSSDVNSRNQRPQENVALMRTDTASMYLRDRILYWFNRFDRAVVARIPNFLHNISWLRKIPSYKGLYEFSATGDSYDSHQLFVRCSRCNSRKSTGGVLCKCCRKLNNWTLKLLSKIGGHVLKFLLAIVGFKTSTPMTGGYIDEDEEMLIVDAGIAFNSPYPLVLHPARKVDLIISFDFSYRDTDGNLPFGELIKAEKWAKQRGVRFPDIYPALHYIEQEWNKGNRRELYIFEGLDAPTIMHFVMINESFRNVDEQNTFDIHPTYDTKRFSYSTDEFDKFNKLIQHIVDANHLTILHSIGREINKKEAEEHFLQRALSSIDAGDIWDCSH